MNGTLYFTVIWSDYCENDKQMLNQKILCLIFGAFGLKQAIAVNRLVHLQNILK